MNLTINSNNMKEVSIHCPSHNLMAYNPNCLETDRKANNNTISCIKCSQRNLAQEKYAEDNGKNENQIKLFAGISTYSSKSTRCLVNYSKIARKEKMKNLKTSSIIEEGKKLIERLEMQEFQEKFFRCHAAPNLPKNIERMNINISGNMFSEYNKLMNNIKRLNTKIRTENLDIWKNPDNIIKFS